MEFRGERGGSQNTAAATEDTGARACAGYQYYAPTKEAMRFKPLVMFSVLVA